MKTLLLAAAFLTLATLAPRAKSQGGFDSAYTTLYQPNDILTDRLSDVGALAAYMKQLTAVCNEFFADETKPDSLDIVVAIKPRERSRVWFVSATRAPGDAQLESLRSKLEKIKPPKVRHGPVVFAIAGAVAGAQRNVSEGASPPIPEEWRQAAKKLGRNSTIDEILKVAWRDGQ